MWSHEETSVCLGSVLSRRHFYPWNALNESSGRCPVCHLEWVIYNNSSGRYNERYPVWREVALIERNTVLQKVEQDARKMLEEIGEVWDL